MREQVALAPGLPLPGEAAPDFQLSRWAALGSWSLAAQRGKSRVLLAFVGRLASRRGQSAAQAWWAHSEALMGHRTSLVVVALEHLAELNALSPPAPQGTILLSDPKGAAALPYGAWNPLFARRAILVDGQGRVRLVQGARPAPTPFLTYLAALHGDLDGQ